MATRDGQSAGWLQAVGGVFAVFGVTALFAEQSAIGICMAVVGLALFASGAAAAREQATSPDSTSIQPSVEGDRGRVEPS